MAAIRAENQRLRRELDALIATANCESGSKSSGSRNSPRPPSRGASALRQIEDLWETLLPVRAKPPIIRPRPLDQGAGPDAGKSWRDSTGGAAPGADPPRRGLFWGRPTLVGIEPASMTAVFCHNTADRKAETWKEHLDPFEHLEFALSDAAKGIAEAVEAVAQARRGNTRGPGPGARPGRVPRHDGGSPRPGPVMAKCRGGLGEGGGRQPQSRRVETTRDQRAGGVWSRVVFGDFSGGGLLPDAVDENDPLDDLGQQRRTVQRSPTL